jgi:hypothetical protein
LDHRILSLLVVQTAQVLLINQVDLVDLAHPCSGRDSVMALWWGILLLGILLLGIPFGEWCMIQDRWQLPELCTPQANTAKTAFLFGW